MTGKTMEVSRELLERVTNNQFLEKERISIARHEALFELRGLLAKTACIDCKETGFCLSIMGDEIRCPCHAPIQFAKPDELQAEPAAQPQGEPVAWMDDIQAELTKARSLLRTLAMGRGISRLELDPYIDAEQPAPVPVVPEGYCIMPRQLTAENGAKALLLGEFKLQVTEECPECRELDEPTEGCEICDGEGEYGQQYTISWDQIKFIYSKAVEGLAVKAETDKP